nr:MerR family DNA-binding protein [Sulfurifustis variabilis]
MVQGRELTIGALARAVGVNVETIRYYHRIGLLPLPGSRHGAFRRYDGESLKRVRFIRRAQRLGFSLEEIAALLGLADGRHCRETRDLAQKKLRLIDEKLADLAAIRKALRSLIAACGRGGGGHGCPIIDSLNEDEEPGSAR